jgi:hypothetical protein
MDKATVVALRQELHQLTNVARANPDKKIDVPLIIQIDHGNTVVDENNSCIMWDDSNEVFYSIEYNNDVNDKLYDICPMRIRAFQYSAIISITARTDLNMLMDFFDAKITDGITNDSTKEKYRKAYMDMRNPKTFAAGHPSPSTSKDLPLQQVERFNEDFPLMNPSALMANLENSNPNLED